MEVIQESFKVPDDIKVGLATGILMRCGGVVRCAVGEHKGEIVKHLEPTEVGLKDHVDALVKGIFYKVSGFAKDHPIVTSFFVAVSAFGGTVSVIGNVKRKDKINNFQNKLKIYIDAMEDGKVTEEIIDNLLNAINELKQDKKYSKIKIKLNIADLEVIVNAIYGYTKRLSELNNQDVFEKPTSDDFIVRIEDCLKFQKEIFERAA